MFATSECVYGSGVWFRPGPNRASYCQTSLPYGASLVVGRSRMVPPSDKTRFAGGCLGCVGLPPSVIRKGLPRRGRGDGFMSPSPCESREVARALYCRREVPMRLTRV